jgi:RNA polymerase sigma-70 factor (ECF subfamily)
MGLVRYRGVDASMTGFEEFYLARRDGCLRAVVGVGADPIDAEDLVAEAFARAWASWRKVSRHPAPEAWVVRTALNANISRWRRARRETPLAEYDRVSLDRVDDLDHDLLAHVQGLPRRQREVIALRVFLDLDVAQTAATLGIAQGTVTAHMTRAVTTLRTQLSQPPASRNPIGAKHERH